MQSRIFVLTSLAVLSGISPLGKPHYQSAMYRYMVNFISVLSSGPCIPKRYYAVSNLTYLTYKSITYVNMGVDIPMLNHPES